MLSAASPRVISRPFQLRERTATAPRRVQEHRINRLYTCLDNISVPNGEIEPGTTLVSHTFPINGTSGRRRVFAHVPEGLAAAERRERYKLYTVRTENEAADKLLNTLWTDIEMAHLRSNLGKPRRLKLWRSSQGKSSPPSAGTSAR